MFFRSTRYAGCTTVGNNMVTIGGDGDDQGMSLLGSEVSNEKTGSESNLSGLVRTEVCYHDTILL